MEEIIVLTVERGWIKMKNDLISRQAAIDAFWSLNVEIRPSAIGAILNILNGLPTIDVMPVRHGKWIDIDEQSYTWKVRCSVCGHERSMMSTQGEYPNYCEHCGARMDEE